MRLFFVVLSLLAANLFFSQTKTIVVDSLFREDQIYASLSYNLVQNRPSGFKQFGFSPTITVGILRDFPITSNRKWALAPGVGYAYNNIKQFISASELLGNDAFGSDAIRSTIFSHAVEFPLELRWRNATPESHKFWRIYSGIKASYVFASTLKYDDLDGAGEVKENSISYINRWQYGVYLGFGYNTWNPYVYYGFTPIFKDGTQLKNLNFGLIFYIL